MLTERVPHASHAFPSSRYAHFPGTQVLNHKLVSAGSAFLAQLAQSIQRHPKRLTAAIATLMLTAGGGAFAVASLGPDPADMPVRTLTQTIPSLVEGSTLADLTDLNDFSLFRTDYTRSSDTPESLLQRLGIADPSASAFLRSNELARQHVFSRNGRLVSAEASNDHQLRKLTVRWIESEDSQNFQRLVLERDAQGQFVSTVSTAPLVVNTRLTGGTIHSTLFAATDAAGLPDAVAVQVVDIFSEINFHRLHKGDRFSVIYETLEADGEFSRSGRVLAGRIPKPRQAAPSHVVPRARPAWLLLRHGRLQPAPRLPEFPRGILARQQHLCNAQAPHPQHMAPPFGHRLCCPHRHQSAYRG